MPTFATVNGAGAARKNTSNPELLAKTLKDFDPDLIGIEEVISVPQLGRDDVETFQKELGDKYYSLFSSTLDSDNHPHPQKWKSEIFKDYGKNLVRQGLGMFVRCGGDRDKETISMINPWSKDDEVEERIKDIGSNLPPHPFVVYQGNRDTEPRRFMMTKLIISGTKMLFLSTQLSTLKEEDEKIGNKKIRRPTIKGIKLREKQVSAIVDYVKSYQESFGAEEPIVLVGDFNCEPDAKELEKLEELGLVHAHLGSKDNWINRTGWTQAPELPSTHRERYHPSLERQIMIDSIYYSKKYFKVTEAHILEVNADETGRMISDHNPVVVKLELV